VVSNIIFPCYLIVSSCSSSCFHDDFATWTSVSNNKKKCEVGWTFENQSGMV